VSVAGFEPGLTTYTVDCCQSSLPSNVQVYQNGEIQLVARSFMGSFPGVLDDRDIRALLLDRCYTRCKGLAK
jgi:hypothetical protein